MLQINSPEHWTASRCSPQEIMPRVVQAGTRDGDRRESVSQPLDVPAECGGRPLVPRSPLAARESQDRDSRAGDLARK